MYVLKRVIPFAQLLLISPAALFMVALILRGLGPVQYQPAYLAQQVVMWYSARLWTLWVLLIALPLCVLGMGCAMMVGQRAGGVGLRSFHGLFRTSRPMLSVSLLALLSGLILVIVALHVLMN